MSRGNIVKRLGVGTYRTLFDDDKAKRWIVGEGRNCIESP